MSDLVALVERDHRDLEEQLAKLAATLDVAVARQLRVDLDRHLDAEASVVYRVVAAEFPNGALVAGEGEDDRAELRSLTRRIGGTAPERLPALVEELRAALELHVDTEETEVLPQVRAVLEPADFTALGPAFDRAKDHPPNGPEA
jgi:hypothetical protein